MKRKPAPPGPRRIANLSEASRDELSAEAQRVHSEMRKNGGGEGDYARAAGYSPFEAWALAEAHSRALARLEASHIPFDMCFWFYAFPGAPYAAEVAYREVSRRGGEAISAPSEFHRADDVAAYIRASPPRMRKVYSDVLAAWRRTLHKEGTAAAWSFDFAGEARRSADEVFIPGQGSKTGGGT